jgi:hypothetical protein
LRGYPLDEMIRHVGSIEGEVRASIACQIPLSPGVCEHGALLRGVRIGTLLASCLRSFKDVRHGQARYELTPALPALLPCLPNTLGARRSSS